MAVSAFIELGSLAHFLKSIVINLRIKVDVSLKLASHLKQVVKSSFFHMWQLAQIKPILPQHLFEIVIYYFITPRLD